MTTSDSSPFWLERCGFWSVSTVVVVFTRWFLFDNYKFYTSIFVTHQWCVFDNYKFSCIYKRCPLCHFLLPSQFVDELLWERFTQVLRIERAHDWDSIKSCSSRQLDICGCGWVRSRSRGSFQVDDDIFESLSLTLVVCHRIGESCWGTRYRTWECRIVEWICYIVYYTGMWGEPPIYTLQPDTWYYKAYIQQFSVHWLTRI